MQERKRVLITVKSYPLPSRTHDELSEILGYVVLNPELLLVIEIEREFLRILRE